MSINKKKITVEVPHRISGFFEIVDKINGIKIINPERIGSRGAGFNLNAIGRTTIEIEKLRKSKNSKCIIYINNYELTQKAETTYFIFKHIKKYIINPIKIKIFHSFDLPVGCGYGASGCGAIGTIIGLNNLLNLNLSNFEKGKIAHVAEVVNKTGLGTVCGQLGGGLCILKEPGYPCVSERIKVPTDLKIICGSFGTIQTKLVLSSPSLSLKIKKAGKIALQKLMLEPNIRTFINASIEFVKETDILNILNLTKTKELMNDLNKINIIGASMNQLGRSVYAICKNKEVKKVIEVFKSYKPEIKIYQSSINNHSSRVLNNN